MAIDTSLRARLYRLFSTNVIVRRIGKDKIKTIDTSNKQITGVTNSNPFGDRFKRIHTTSNPRYNQNYGEIRLAKLEYYNDYEAMDFDAIINSALDIYADESLVRNTEGKTLIVHSENDKIKQILNNLFYDIINIEHTLWPLIRSLCKYGDYYWYLDLEKDIGIKNIIPISPYYLRREEGFDSANPQAYRFQNEGAEVGGYSMHTFSADGGNTFNAYEMAHFRLLSDSNFLPYGRSAIEGARKEYKKLTLMEDAMLLYTIMRAPERRVFKIDVGNMSPEAIDVYMEQVKNELQKTPYLDERTGDYDLKYNLFNMLEDFFFPVRAGNTSTEVDTLGGLQNNSAMEITEYLRKKMMAALKIPSSFLGYEENIGKSTLAAEDIRFARTIERIQNVVTSELKKIAIIHLYIQGYRNEELASFDLKLNNPSIVYKRQEVDLMNEQMSLVSNLLDSKMFSRRWVYENIFKLTKSEYSDIEKEVLEDQKLRFRHQQIENEGNDPKQSGESYGTAHDLAAMQLSASKEGNEEKPDGVEPPKNKDDDGRGRPERKGSFGTHKDVNGFDPDGKKDINKAMTISKKDQPNPELKKKELDVAHILSNLKGLEDYRTKKAKIIKELFTNYDEDVKAEESSLLDENKIEFY